MICFLMYILYRQALGSFRYNVALSEDGHVYSNGMGYYGELGHGIQKQMLRNWKLIESIRNIEITKIMVGSKHTILLDKNGNVYSFGRNKYSELGLNIGSSIESQSNPMMISYFKKNNIKIIDIKCGEVHSVALDSNFEVYTWGDNSYEQCDMYTSEKIIKEPAIPLITNHGNYPISSIECGGFSTVFLTKDSLHLYIIGKDPIYLHPMNTPNLVSKQHTNMLSCNASSSDGLLLIVT